MVPTAIILRPPSGLSKGRSGALAIYSPRAAGHFPDNHKFITPAMEVSNSSDITAAEPLRASSKCWALNRSLPHEVPFGKLLMAFNNAFESTEMGAAATGSEGIMGGGA